LLTLGGSSPVRGLTHTGVTNGRDKPYERHTAYEESVSRYAQSVTEKAKALEMASANETQEFASSEGMQ
ncbi:MAG: hypothetical protein J6S65_01200, partial [Bacteroidaceae bacterium]|nr:hypothetical protein [Bacteroidaceae bacterium]